MYNLYLPSGQAAILEGIRQSVVAREPMGRIDGLARRTSQEIQDPQFAFTYAGTLLAKFGRTDDAINLLENSCVENSFSRCLTEFLRKFGKFAINQAPFTTSRPYDVWQHTRFYKQYRELTADKIVQCSSHILMPHDSDKPPVIVDVGTGNGILITDIVNALAAKHSLKECRLILIDQSEEMLASAAEYVKKNSIIPTHLTLLHGKIQHMSAEMIARTTQGDPAWFVNASASLHHMPRHMKIETLRKLAQVSRHCFVSEFNANHDLPAEDSPEFYYSVTQHYKYYLDDVLDCAVSDEDKEVCINEFLLAEAINMLKNPRETRVDYHASMEEWLSAAQEAGYRHVNGTANIRLQEGRALTYTVELET